MSRRITRIALSCAFAFPGALLAQDVAIQNLSPIPQSGWVSFTVPAASAEGRGALLKPFNWPAAWGRASGLRGRMAHVFCGKIQPGEIVRGDLVAVAEGDTEAAAPAAVPERPPELLRFGEHSWRPRTVTIEQDGPRQIIHARGPVAGTMLQANAWFYVYRGGERVTPFEVFVANCDTTSPAVRQSVSSIEFVAPRGVYPAVDFLRARGGGDPVERSGEVLVPLHGATWFGHGQGAGWTGRLINWRDIEPGDVPLVENLAAAREGPLVGVFLGWKERWGPWSKAPESHPTFQTEDAISKIRDQQWAEFLDLANRPGHLWRSWPWGLGDRPSGTGAQQDFGVTKLAPVFIWGLPAHMYALVPAVLRDGGRPSFFYEPDGAPLVLALHPRWATYGLHTHWHHGVSPDRLGKGDFVGSPWNTLSPKDFPHCSSHNLSGWTTMTGSELGKHMCRHEITAFVAHGRDFGLGETRAYGRTPLAMLWNHLATGDDRIWPAMADVVAHPKFDWLLGPAQEFDVRPIGVDRPNGRYFKGKYPYWNPWHEGLAIAGLDALSLMLAEENPRLERILAEMCRTQIKDGWAKVGGRWQPAYAVRWLGGQELTPEQTQDPEFFAPSVPGTNFPEWCWAAVKISMRRLADSDRTLALKAATIDEALRQAWLASPPRTGLGRIGRAAEWSAVR